MIRWCRFSLLAGMLLSILGAAQGIAQTSDPSLWTMAAKDAEGRPIQGADILVQLNGASAVHAITGADGLARLRFEPGVATISIHRDGYLPFDKKIDTRNTSDHVVELQLTPAPHVQETVTVESGGDQGITQQHSSPETEIKPKEAVESPLRPTTLTDALPLVPGVVRDPNGQIQIEGAGEMHSALIVNSVDQVDPATGRFGPSVPIDVVAALHVMTTPYLAQYGRFTAGVVTADTRPGGNKWSFDLNDPLPEFRIRSGHLRGLKSATPRLDISGPLVKDRTFVSEGFALVDNKVAVRTLPFPVNETKLTMFNSFTQVDSALSSRQNITVTFHAVPQKIRYANLDFFNPQEVSPNGDSQS